MPLKLMVSEQDKIYLSYGDEADIELTVAFIGQERAQIVIEAPKSVSIDRVEGQFTKSRRIDMKRRRDEKNQLG